MRYILDANGYLNAVSFGADITCAGVDCTEYKGTTPTGYATLEAWYVDNIERLYKWKIVSGNLTQDSGAMEPEDCTTQDRVVSQGTSGAWTYQQWDSGIFEVFGAQDITGVDCTTEYGNGFCSDYIDPPGSFPRKMAYPVASFFGYYSGEGFPATVECAENMSAFGAAQRVRLVRPKSAEGMTGTLTWLYKGFWKGLEFVPSDGSGLLTADGMILTCKR